MLVALGAAAMASCTPAPAPPPTPRTPPPVAGRAVSRTAAVLAAATCPQLRDRSFAVASKAPGPVDLFVLVKRCAAHADRDELVLAVEAYAWLAVDEDLGAVSVREFVHVTLRLEVRAASAIRYEDSRATLTLTARPGASVRVEPVGMLELEALNWASLLALEIAPAAGTSPEALAKAKVREEAERALQRALATPVLIAYDARTATTSVGGAPTSETSARPMRVVRRGSAITEVLAPSSEPTTARVHVAGEARIAARAVCRAHAEQLLDADRRGDQVTTDDWTIATHDSVLPIPPMPCSWVIAARAVDASTAALVTIAPPGASSKPPPMRAAQRWVSFDVLRADAVDESAGAFTIDVSTDAWRRVLAPRGNERPSPSIVEVAPDEGVIVRARAHAGETSTTIAERRLPVDTVGNVDLTFPLSRADGRSVATIHARARVRAAPLEDEAER